MNAFNPHTNRTDTNKQLQAHPWMVEMRLPNPLPERFWMEFEEQQRLMKQLLGNGQVSSLTLDKSRRRLWVTVNAVAEKQVYDTLAILPITAYAQDMDVTQLEFHNSFAVMMSPMNLN